ncbi:MAG: Tol-Pal system beta propeller repeat protein TolB [Pseudomonadota bacterium]
MTRLISIIVVFFLSLPAWAQTRIEVTEGVIEPLPIAIPNFVSETPNAAGLAEEIRAVVAADLTGSGLFREIPREAHISPILGFEAPIQFQDWRVLNAASLVTASVSLSTNNQMVVKFRLFDVATQRAMGNGLQFVAPQGSWRRIAHKVADSIYSRLTGEGPYFDSRVVFISEEGPKDARKKRLAIMDYDGANVRYLTGADDIVLAPRFSPNAKEVIYTSYETGQPSIFVMNVDSGSKRQLTALPDMLFSPRFAPDGRSVVLSQIKGGNTDLFRLDLESGATTQLTQAAAIDTAPSFSPDGSRIVFESDRGGGQQLYVMSSRGGEANRISFGQGRYGTPVWSPRGDKIAFTKILGGEFYIGVMDVDGSNERLLTRSFLDEGPTWAPNGRVLMFFRETAGANGAPNLYSVDVTGLNLRKVPTPFFASDPAWSGVLE